MNGLVDITHSKCGGRAFRYQGPIYSWEVISPKRAVLADGTHPLPRTWIYCEHCGEQVMEGDLVY